MPRRNGFTLIELLVVIAIIAILAAILFPVFSVAKKTAQKASCQASMKELLQAALMYEDDANGGILPGCIDLNKNGTSWGNAEFNEFWCALIDKYIRQLKNSSTTPGSMTADMRGVYVCPSSPPVTGGGYLQPFLARPYGYNYYYLGGNPNNGVTTNWHKGGEVVKTTTTIRIIENWNYQAAGYRNGVGSMMCYPPSITNVCYPSYVWPPGWHSGTSTVGWYDGHVSGVKLVAPRPGGPGSQPSDFTGVMTTTLSGADDPYFRLSNPKP